MDGTTVETASRTEPRTPPVTERMDKNDTVERVDEALAVATTAGESSVTASGLLDDDRPAGLRGPAMWDAVDAVVGPCDHVDDSMVDTDTEGIAVQTPKDVVEGSASNSEG